MELKWRNVNEMEYSWQKLIEEAIGEMKRELLTSKSQEYKNGISSALLIIFTVLRHMEQGEEAWRNELREEQKRELAEQIKSMEEKQND